MEEKTKQTAIDFPKGLTAVPSDILCTDGELSVCQNMIADNGEMKPIQLPGKIGPNDGEGALFSEDQTLQRVHDGRYIFSIDTSQGSVKQGALYYKNPDSTDGYNVLAYKGELRDVTTTGNTVIAATTEELHYALWSGGEYKDLGGKIPEPEVEMYIQEWNYESTTQDIASDLISDHHVGRQQGWNDAVVGCYSTLRNKMRDMKYFTMPFAVRVAVRLIGGQRVNISSPRLFFPCCEKNLISYRRGDFIVMVMHGCRLFYKMETDYDDWQDIVECVELFVSKDVDIYNTVRDAVYVEDYNIIHTATSGGYVYESTFRDGCFVSIDNGRYGTSGGTMDYKESRRGVDGNHYTITKMLEVRDFKEVYTELAEESVFFRLCELPRTTSFTPVDNYFKSTDLRNITTMESLNDDFHSHEVMTAESIFNYNGRLHLVNVKRGFFDGFTTFCGREFPETVTEGQAEPTLMDYTIEIAIDIEGAWKIVRQDIVGTKECIGLYIYFPDTRAKYARVTQYSRESPHPATGQWVLKLSEHHGLNGSYFVTNPMNTQPQHEDVSPAEDFPTMETFNGKFEELEDTLVVSEVDNPFAFTAKGYKKVGGGSIIGVAPVSMALNEYMHGTKPAIVFATDGVWSLSVDSEGYYTNPQSVAREVCSGAKTIVQVDNGIFFFSLKGLMYVDTAGVRCVSEQMAGTDLEDFGGDVIMAYDYKDSLLHMVKILGENAMKHYVYNMKNGVFAEVTNDERIWTKSVNNYPDTVIQTGGGYVLSMTGKPNTKDDTRVYAAELETRPVKFGNVLTLKSIRQVRHLLASGSASIAFRIFASNDCIQWIELHSLKGKPWKYYRFSYTITNLNAADRFCGTVCITQERRTDRLR